MAIVADVPARPQGLELIGEMRGSGYRTPPALVRRQDGQTLQLTPLLYAVLEAVDGSRGYAEIARQVSDRTGRRVSAADVHALVERQLRPRGLLLEADGSAAPLKRTSPLTGLRLKFAVSDPVMTRRLTDPFTVLFHPLVWLPLIVLFGGVAWWLLMDRGLASATYQAFAKPDLLMLVLAVTILSAGFHEFGHAAAARRGGAQPGVMGAGWFLLWPAFYTDVTDTYRLGKGGRIRTDLGGLYFNAIVAVLIAVAWWLTGWDALLLVIAAQVLQMVRQLAPLVRFDGYHVLADVTGVPDLFSRIGPILTSFWPGRWNDPRVSQLKWWVRAIVTMWVIIVVPLLLLALLALVLATPRLIGTALESIAREWNQATVHWNAGSFLDAAGAVLSIGIILLPIVAIAIVFGRIAFSMVGGIWRRTAGKPLQRGGAGALVLTLGIALIFAWWPNAERYRPIQPYEDGTILSVARLPLAAAGLELASPPQADGGEVVTVLPSANELPTEAAPQLAVVLVPDSSTETADPPDAGTSPSTGSTEPAWVFPFNEPLPPEAGDNQALAVNTTDGGVTYDVSIAMVWVTDEEAALNVNEAYAFASCTDCVTVAVAFQVVAIVGSANVVIPQNLSAAVNYDCFRCITAAIASQLVVTVESLPDAQQQVALADVWEELVSFAGTIPTLPLADIIAQLEDYKARIAEILGVAQQPASSPSPTGSEAPAATSVASSPATSSPGPASSTGANAGSSPPESAAAVTPAPSASRAATPSGTPDLTSAPTASGSPTPVTSAE